MGDTTLTIGVTCYNDERFLRTCLDSLAAQTYRHLDVIVIDDASTDGSVAIAREFVEQDPERFRLIEHETNSGSLRQGRVDTIREARGDYVAHLDADDAWEPACAQRLMGVAAQDPSLDWITPSVALIDENDQVTQVWDYPQAGFTPHVAQALLRGWQTASVATPTVGMFRLAFLRANDLTWYELPNTAQGEDALTCIKYLEKSPRIAILPDPLYRYRIHGGNMSSSAVERAKMIVDLKDYYVSRFSEMVYLPHPRFLSLEYGSDEYHAFTSYLIAADLLQAKTVFRVPDVFEGDAAHDMEQVYAIFDEAIVRYAKRALEYGDFHADELSELLDAIGAGDAS